MASSTSSMSSFFLGALIVLLTSCCAPVTPSPSFASDNPIRLVLSDGVRDVDDDLSIISPLMRSSIRAIYQFGDSISDTGNLMRENPLSDCAKRPYGETYFHKPTGRCSNGLLIIDYFARFLRLPYLDAYLNKEGKFKHGVNFAVAGATALDNSTLASKYNVVSATTNSSLSVQLRWFKSHLASIRSPPSENRRKFSKSLFIMGEIGGNDYSYAFQQGKTFQEVEDQMVPEIIQTIKSAVEEVIEHGATRVVIPGNFPVGCMTIILVMFKTNDTSKYDEWKCLKRFNEFAEFHNYQLKQTIQTLQRDHPNVTFLYLDYYKTMTEIIRHPKLHGFDENSVHKACCGSGDGDYNYDFNKMCGSVEVNSCVNPHERVVWDGIHLTQHAYQVMAKQMIRDVSYAILNL